MYLWTRVVRQLLIENLNNEELSRQQIARVRRVNTSWNKKSAKAFPTITSGRDKSNAALMCQEFQLRPSAAIFIWKENVPLRDSFSVSVHDLLDFVFFSCWFFFIYPFIPSILPGRPSFKCKPASDTVWAWFVYGGWWLAVEMQSSLGTGPVKSRQALDD